MLSTHIGIQFLADLKITSQCLNSIFINLCTQPLLGLKEKPSKFRLELKICTHAPNSELLRTGNIKKARAMTKWLGLIPMQTWPG